MVIITANTEQEQLIAQAIEAGLIRSAQEALDIGVESLRERLSQPRRAGRPPGRRSLVSLFAESPLKGLNLQIDRDQDPGRPLNL